MGADTKANTWPVRGRSALEVGDLRLTQHLCELGRPPTDVVVEKTAKDGQGGYSERANVSRGPLTRLLSRRAPPPPLAHSLARTETGVEGASALAAVLKETQITNLKCVAARAFAFCVNAR